MQKRRHSGRGLDEVEQDDLLEDEHEDAVQQQRREHVLVDGDARNAENPGKVVCFIFCASLL